jgi:hypothetical protein
MASNFPSSLDTFTNPSSTDAMDSVSVPHATQHSDLNDAVEALQAKVGADSSGVASSHDYKIAQLEARTEGKILQVVSTAKTDTFSASVASGNFSAVTGLSASITPASASNKILVTTHLHLSMNTASGTGSYRIMRGATPVGVGDLAGSRGQQTAALNNYDNDTGDIANVSMTFLDSPATTSATTYSVEFYTYTGTTQTLYLNRSQLDANNSFGVRPISTITVMEVSA